MGKGQFGDCLVRFVLYICVKLKRVHFGYICMLCEDGADWGAETLNVQVIFDEGFDARVVDYFYEGAILLPLLALDFV